jgi:hypothetical protein
MLSRHLRVEQPLGVADPFDDIVASRVFAALCAATARCEHRRVRPVGDRDSVADRTPRTLQILVTRLEPQSSVLEPRLLEIAWELIVFPEQRQPFLVRPDETIRVERDLDLQKIAVNDATHARPPELDHHRRPRAARQREIHNATIATLPNEAQTKNVTSPAMTCSFYSTIRGDGRGSPEPPAQGASGSVYQSPYDAGAPETSYASTPFEPSRCSNTTFVPSTSDLYPSPVMVAVIDEQILVITLVRGDEPEPLRITEPFHGSGCHRNTSLANFRTGKESAWAQPNSS